MQESSGQTTEEAKRQADDVIDLNEDDARDGAADKRSGRYGELWSNNMVVVYTDGASRNNRTKCLRYAGYGAFWASSHPFNIARPLPGAEQTNNRAELYALVEALGLEVRPV